MLRRDAIIAEARKWIGTPYQHRASMRGVGVDCAQLVIEVGVAVGALEPSARAERGYGRLPNPAHALDAVRRHLAPTDHAEPGDILFLAWRRDMPTHLGIMAEAPAGYPTLIHACGESLRVVEHRLDPIWARRVHSFWKFRGND